MVVTVAVSVIRMGSQLGLLGGVSLSGSLLGGHCWQGLIMGYYQKTMFEGLL